MSVLFGLLRLDGREVDVATLEKMGRSAGLPLPERPFLRTYGSLGLGRCPAGPNDEARDFDSADFAVCWTGRLDNSQDLVERLGLTRLRVTPTPTELMVAAYRRWGTSFASQIVGDFAIALYDFSTRSLICARDHVGVEPLYYSHIPGRVFAFSSRISPLLSLDVFPPTVDEEHIADHLSQVFDDPAASFYRHVRRLPPAHTLDVTPKRISVSRHWSFNPSIAAPVGSDRDHAEAFRAVFMEAVRCRLPSSGPVGFLLSGGLDSTSIVAASRRLREDRDPDALHTFSAIFPSLDAASLRRIDERNHIDTAVRLGGIIPHFVTADLLSPLAQLDELIRQQEEPAFAPNLYMHRGIFAKARQTGVGVLLDGIDGDTTVSHGYERLSELILRLRWRSLWTETKLLSSKTGQRFSPIEILWSLALRPLVPEPLYRLSCFARRRPYPVSLQQLCIHPAFAARTNLQDRVRRLHQSHSLKGSYSKRAHFAALSSGMIPYALETLRKAACGYNVDLRFPFFDRRLMEFCLALPASQKLSGGWDRIVLRRAMDGIVPPSIQWRADKANLSPNFEHGLARDEADLLRSIVRDDAGVLDRYYDMDLLLGACDRFLSAPTRHPSEALVLFGAAVLAKWLTASQNVKDSAATRRTA